MFPPNLVQACFEQAKTHYDTTNEKTITVNYTNETTGEPELRNGNDDVYVLSGHFSREINVSYTIQPNQVSPICIFTENRFFLKS